MAEDQLRVDSELGIYATSSMLLKNLSESFDGAQDERRGFDIDDYPFMLRFSKHSNLFQQPASVLEPKFV
jgi:hypothetical protein